MLEIQKVFLIVKFFNRTFCKKGLKAKISCFFSLLFLFNPRRMKLEKTLYSWPHIGLRNTKKISSTELHKWSESMVNVENCNFLKVSCNFQSLVWVKWKQSVCSISFLYSTTFYIFFLPFVVLKIFKFKYGNFCQTFCFHFQIRMIWTAIL